MRAIFLYVILCLGVGCSGPTAPTPQPPPPPPPIPPATGPVLTCPSPVSATTTTLGGAPVTYSAPTASGGTAPVTVTCTPASGSMFPIGTTQVSCTAADAAGLTASCGFPVSLALQPTLAKTRFLAFGDSATSGEVTVPTLAGDGQLPFKLLIVPSASYPTQLQSLLVGRYSTQTFVMTNAGKPGEWAVDGALRFPGVITSVRPEVVLLLEGYNDPLSANRGMSDAAAAMESMAKEARFRGARVFLASLTPSRAGVSAIPTGVLTAYNDRLRSVAAGENAVFVDLYAALASNVSVYIGPDGLHPTEAGYRQMAEAFFAAIRADLEVK